MRLRFFREQRGIGLIETVVAMGLLGLIGVAILNGLTTTSNMVMISQEDVTVESLAKSQAEYIKAQAYIPVDKYGTGDVPKVYAKIDIPPELDSQYDIEITTPQTRIAPDLGPFECQSLNIVVKRNGKGVFTMSIYKEGSTA